MPNLFDTGPCFKCFLWHSMLNLHVDLIRCLLSLPPIWRWGKCCTASAHTRVMSGGVGIYLWRSALNLSATQGAEPGPLLRCGASRLGSMRRKMRHLGALPWRSKMTKPWTVAVSKENSSRTRASLVSLFLWGILRTHPKCGALIQAASWARLNVDVSSSTERADIQGGKRLMWWNRRHGFGARRPEFDFYCLWTLGNSHNFFEHQFLHPKDRGHTLYHMRKQMSNTIKCNMSQRAPCT